MRIRQSTRPSRTIAINRLFSALAALGILIALLGVAFDLIPGASPGISLPQLLMMLAGALLAIIALGLRRPRSRALAFRAGKKRLPQITLIVIVTLLLLEAALSLGGLPTYYPLEIPADFLQPAPWWTCDAAGCHYVHDEMQAACARGRISGRRCIINRQGFHDTQDFVAGAELEGRLRILILGDSFAFGGSAAMGKSFVETIERRRPAAIVWNTAIPGAGTNQALMSYNVYAPILRPQLTILGFYMNDFDDNMLPVDSYFMGLDAADVPLSIRQYQIDRLGQPIKLDQQSDLFYRYHGVDPPGSDLQSWLGKTRVGSIALRFSDAIGQMLSQAQGLRRQRQVGVTRDALIALKAAAAGETDLLLLLIPRREDLEQPGARYQDALQLAEALGVPYLDPRSLLHPDADYARAPDIHWNSAGHQKIAALLIECLDLYQAQGSVAGCAVPWPQSSP